ncbi:MAG TPA: beta-galactosidase [Ktedonobacterales bacterium]|nr:beta-galactosidase [Ktedonobacterales bacterium]
MSNANDNPLLARQDTLSEAPTTPRRTRLPPRAPLPELRLRRATQPLTDQWRRTPVEPRATTLLGVSFRPLQAEAMGLDGPESLRDLLAYPFQIIRLAAYWNRIETAQRQYDFEALDWQVDAAERAGKRIILAVGAVKAFGYPEVYVPAHHLGEPLREGRLVTPSTHASLLDAAAAFVTHTVERYRDRSAIVAWQVEHEAVDPLGVEHSWRLSADFARAEVAEVRAADPTRPIMMNGFLPTSLPVRAQQWWSTRDQGDSLAVAQRLADIVGVDYYPRHALIGLGPRTIYLDGAASRTPRSRQRALAAWASAAPGRRLMISEGQAEPWEAVTTPPNPTERAMASCLPEHVIENYNHCMGWARENGVSLYAYLFWGVEYWLARQRSGDASYTRAFARILEHA